MNQVNLEDIFTNVTVTINVRQQPTRLDPLSDIMNHMMSVPYSPRTAKSMVPFMDFTKGDRRWVDHLVAELTTIADVYREDKIIMLGYASAKRGTGGKQTWQQFVDELYRDKTQTGRDYSEGQLKHLPVLIDQLRTGKRLAGCKGLEFIDAHTGIAL